MYKDLVVNATSLTFVLTKQQKMLTYDDLLSSTKPAYLTAYEVWAKENNAMDLQTYLEALLVQTNSSGGTLDVAVNILSAFFRLNNIKPIYYRVDHWFKKGNGSKVLYFDNPLPASLEVLGMELVTRCPDYKEHTTLQAFCAWECNAQGWETADKEQFQIKTYI